MKPPELESRLWHIATACEKVLRVTSGMTFSEYAADDLIPDVVERQMMIVGEAIARIAKVDKEVAAQLGDFPRVIAFRNQLVHNYPHVDPEQVWIIIQRDVPLLLKRVRTLLTSLDSNRPHPA